MGPDHTEDRDVRNQWHVKETAESAISKASRPSKNLIWQQLSNSVKSAATPYAVMRDTSERISECMRLRLTHIHRNTAGMC